MNESGLMTVPATPKPRFCEGKCGKAVGPYERVCMDCFAAVQVQTIKGIRTKPLASNCGVCGKDNCKIEHGAAKRCPDCQATVDPAILRCWPCYHAMRKRDGLKCANGDCTVCIKEAKRQEAKTLVVCPSCTKGVDGLVGGQCTECNDKKPKRPSWDDYFFEMAKLVSTRATCPRASVGVVLVDGAHRVIATGYNGAPASEPHCVDVGCDIYANHCMRARHGEESALASAQAMVKAVDVSVANPDFLDYYGDNITAYVAAPLPVCTSCARALKRAGVTEVKHRSTKP